MSARSTYMKYTKPAGYLSLDAVMGIFIEISFIATFTQRFFGR